ncbi:MAG TPA: S1C family serine protease [Deinococcales bacterium]|nr:S1C family serine protease [Deinococcales bacterium]
MNKFRIAIITTVAATLAPAALAQSSDYLCQINARANVTLATPALQAVADKARNATVRITTPSGLGTGFFISADGILVTAYHVIKDDAAWRAVLPDRTQYPLTLLGFDERKDLAVMRATGNSKPFEFVSILDAAPKVGENLIAIGNSCSSFIRARFGKVTDMGRDVSPAYPSGFLVTDMPLAPGDSGGPVFDSAGRVAGVSSMIGFDEKNPDADRPAGFVAPLWNQAELIERMKGGFRDEIPFIGISMIEYGKENVTEFGGVEGIIILTVNEKSGAAKAGLRAVPDVPARAPLADRRAAIAASDIITAVDGKKVSSTLDLLAYLRSRQVGDTVEFTVQRGKESVKVSVTLGSRRAIIDSK